MDAYAQFRRRPHHRLQFHVAAAGKQVHVVHAGGAAAQQQFAQADRRRRVHRLGVDRLPHGVEPRQPLEEPGVLHRGHAPCERLEEMMVRVDQPRRDEPAGAVDQFEFLRPVGARRGLVEAAGLDRQRPVHLLLAHQSQAHQRLPDNPVPALLRFEHRLNLLGLTQARFEMLPRGRPRFPTRRDQVPRHRRVGPTYSSTPSRTEGMLEGTRAARLPAGHQVA